MGFLDFFREQPKPPEEPQAEREFVAARDSLVRAINEGKKDDDVEMHFSFAKRMAEDLTEPRRAKELLNLSKMEGEWRLKGGTIPHEIET